MHHKKALISAGDMLVTGQGEIVLEESVQHDPDLTVCVEFDAEEAPDPCVGPCYDDEIAWELDVHHKRGYCHTDCERVRLRIRWSVGKARTITWRVTSP